MGRLTRPARQHFLFGVPALGKILTCWSLCFWRHPLASYLLDAPPRGGFSILSLSQPGDAGHGFCLARAIALLAGNSQHPGSSASTGEPHAARDAFAGVALALVPGALLAGLYLMFDVYRAKQDLVPWLLLRIAMTAGFVALVEEFLFRGVLLGLAAKAFGRWPAAAGVSLVFAGVHFLRPPKRRTR